MFFLFSSRQVHLLRICLKSSKDQQRKASSLGSGFIINKNGTVITNNHVIANAEDIVVRVNGKDYKAKVLGADPLADIAVIKINSKDSFTPVKFGDSTKLELATG